jgi:hypothetical protein
MIDISIRWPILLPGAAKLSWICEMVSVLAKQEKADDRLVSATSNSSRELGTMRIGSNS